MGAFFSFQTARLSPSKGFKTAAQPDLKSSGLGQGIEYKPWLTTEEGFRLFSPFGLPLNQPRSELNSPLRVMVITSLRDIASEKAGSHINVRGESRYFKGSLESLTEAAANGPLSKLIKVVSVVIDDVPGHDGVEGLGYSILPERRRSDSLWIAPADLPVGDNKTLIDVTENIPSDFRKLPLKETLKRIVFKQKFEDKILNKARSVEADLILSDHCLLRFESLHKDPYFLGSVLNIHPGITWEGDPNKVRGLTITADVKERAGTSGYLKCGASLHFINDAIDGGGVICDAERTTINPEDSLDTIRFTNYAASKIPVLIKGLEHYCLNRDTLLLRSPLEMASKTLQ